MSKSDAVTVRELYTLVDQKMEQVNKAIIRVEAKFDTLESGRLTTLEKNVSNMQGKLMMIPILITLAVNIFFFVIELIVKKQ